MSTDDYGTPIPAQPFNFHIQTTAVMEHSRGIAWVADLYMGVTKIGSVEQAGDGGADLVYFSNMAYCTVWNLAVKSAFAGDEEAATYYLLVQEMEGTNA